MTSLPFFQGWNLARLKKLSTQQKINNMATKSKVGSMWGPISHQTN